MPLDVRGYWYGRLVQERGIEVILQKHEIKLLAEAREIRRAGNKPSDVTALEQRAKRVIEGMDPAKRYFFAKEILDRVDSSLGGIRGSWPRR